MNDLLPRRPVLSLLLGALLVGLGCAKSLPPQEPLDVGPIEMSEGEWRVVDHVLVVTDASGTMYYRETFPEAKAITQAFVASMPDRDVRAENPDAYEAGLIGFGGTERSGVPLGSFDRGGMSEAADGLDLLGAVRLGPAGSTPLHVVLSEAQQAFAGRRGTAALVIVSDGVADSPGEAQRAARALAESYPDRICIHTVQVGDDPAGRELLTALSETTECGSARSAASVQDTPAFRTFSRNVFAGAAPPPAVSAIGPCDGIIRMRGIQFDFARAEITPESRVVLDVAVEQLEACGELAVDIVGHTCSMGPAEYNQGLSERRADSAQRHFVGAGIAGGRLRTEGRGENEPIASNDTLEGRRLNRRVELKPQGQ